MSPLTPSFTLDQIKCGLPSHEALLSLLADSFVLLSEDKVVLAPVSHLSFDGRNGDCCIKAAYTRGGDFWVVTPLLHSRSPPLPRRHRHCSQSGVPVRVGESGGWLL